jgi:MFS family permease
MGFPCACQPFRAAWRRPCGPACSKQRRKYRQNRSRPAPPAFPALITLPFPPRSSLRRDLLVSTIDAMAFSVMVGCGETYFSAFALALGLGPVAAGMVASVPILMGALLQLAAPLAVARIGSNRRWVIACTVVQAACFGPMVWWALRGHARLWELLLAASLYWSAGMASVPAWTAWMATLVPDNLRTPYFANRNRLGQFAVFLGFAVSGLVLQWGEAHDGLLTAFAAMFVVAGLARLVSTACLCACREPRPPGVQANAAADAVPLARRVAGALRGMAGRRSGLLVAYLCCFVFGTQMAAPYFTPYMLRELGFSYHAFMLVFGTSFLAKALLLPAIGRLASRVGPLRLIWLASLAIVPLALLWLPSRNVAYLCVVQVLAGACWAAYELAVMLIFFQEVEAEERTGVVTVYNLGVAVATVAGAATGGLILRSLGETWQAYATVFATSCLARLVVIPILHHARRRA